MRSKRVFAAVAFLTLLAFAAFADRAAAADVQIDGVTVTSADVMTLLTALHTALNPKDTTIPIVVSLKPASDMPSYDPAWHYSGIAASQAGPKTLSVWFNRDLKGPALETAIAQAFLLALTDGGFGGATFKEIYDAAAAKDAQLPATATDPYLNRHQLAVELTKLLQP
jgi:hypothetical protein